MCEIVGLNMIDDDSYVETISATDFLKAEQERHFKKRPSDPFPVFLHHFPDGGANINGRWFYRVSDGEMPASLQGLFMMPKDYTAYVEEIQSDEPAQELGIKDALIVFNAIASQATLAPYTHIVVDKSFLQRMERAGERLDSERDYIMNRLKPFLCDFISYYRDQLGNSAGGWLHIVLDDGNLEEGHIYACQQDAEKNGDSFGYFLATLLRYFTEQELQKLYDNDWREVDDWYQECFKKVFGEQIKPADNAPNVSK